VLLPHHHIAAGRSRRRIVRLIGHQNAALAQRRLETPNLGASGVDGARDAGGELAGTGGSRLLQQVRERAAVGGELRFEHLGVGLVHGLDQG
jgi:hypothetical protein